MAEKEVQKKICGCAYDVINLAEILRETERHAREDRWDLANDTARAAETWLDYVEESCGVPMDKGREMLELVKEAIKKEDLFLLGIDIDETLWTVESEFRKCKVNPYKKYVEK